TRASPRSRCDRDYPNGTAGSALNLERRSDHDRTALRELVYIGQLSQSEASRPVHDRVVRERRIGLRADSSIGPDLLDTNPEDVAFLRQELGRFLAETRVVRRAIAPHIQEPFRIVGTRTPSSPKDHPCTRRNAPVLFFPLQARASGR